MGNFYQNRPKNNTKTKSRCLVDAPVPRPPPPLPRSSRVTASAAPAETAVTVETTASAATAANVLIASVPPALVATVRLGQMMNFDERPKRNEEKRLTQVDHGQIP